MEEAQDNALIGVDEFNRVEMRAGTIIEAGPNKKARNPAYKLKIDFGPEIGVKVLLRPDNRALYRRAAYRHAGNMLHQPHSHTHRLSQERGTHSWY